MTNEQRRAVIHIADTIQGEVNRMCVTNDLSELDAMTSCARYNILKLSQLIYDNKFKQNRTEV